MDHTSGGQRGAEHEVTAEQRAEWERRLRARADELGREVAQLALAAGAHLSAEGDRVAGHARAAAVALAAASSPTSPRRRDSGPVLLGAQPDAGHLVTGRGDQPPFAAELAVDRPPHER